MGSGKQLGPFGQKIALAVMCGIFISVGLALWIPLFLLPVLDWSAMKKWREVPCTVLRTPADFAFRYEWDGDTYESSDPGPRGTFNSSLWTIQPGTVTVCYVNPRAPREAVLFRDLDFEILVWNAPLVFVFFPLLALILGLRSIGRPKEAEVPSDSVVLAPRRSSGCGVAMFIVFLLFFGGTAAFIALIPGFRETILVRLFYLIPLVLATLLLFWGLIRSFFGLFKPGVTLTVSPASAAPGQSIEVRWAAKGPFEQVKSFRITLEGREELRSSANRRSDVKTSPIGVIDVAKGGPKDLKRGSVKVKIPAGTMHSFDHGNRSIVWVFRVVGEGRFDDQHRYELATQKAGGS